MGGVSTSRMDRPLSGLDIIMLLSLASSSASRALHSGARSACAFRSIVEGHHLMLQLRLWNLISAIRFCSRLILSKRSQLVQCQPRCDRSVYPCYAMAKHIGADRYRCASAVCSHPYLSGACLLHALRVDAKPVWRADRRAFAARLSSCLQRRRSRGFSASGLRLFSITD